MLFASMQNATLEPICMVVNTDAIMCTIVEGT